LQPLNRDSATCQREMSDSAGARPAMGGRHIKVAALKKPDSGLGPITPKRHEPKITNAKEPKITKEELEMDEHSIKFELTTHPNPDGASHPQMAFGELAPAEPSSSPRISRDGSVVAGSAAGSAAGGARGGGSKASSNSNSRSGERPGSITLGGGDAPLTTLTLHTAAQTQEFADRANRAYRITEIDRTADSDFFLSLATNLRKEGKVAPYLRDGHPLLLAAATDNKSSSSGATATATASSVDVQMILEELGPLEGVTQVYARDAYGRTPLHLAAMNGCADTVYQLLNTYRRSMYRTGVLENVARLERERAVSEAELRAALIKAGKYTAQGWDLKVKRMKELALQVGKPEAGKGSTIPQLVALQHWFEQEVDRIQRAHEIRVEVYRTKNLCIKDKFGRTPLHYAVASGCPGAVLEALLRCSTANLGVSSSMHALYNHQHTPTAVDLGGLTNTGPSAAALSQKRRWFSSGVIYESSTGMEIGRTDGKSPPLSVANARRKESLRLINKSLRNVAWELTHEQSALGAPKPVKAPLQAGQRPGDEEVTITREDGEPATFAEDQEKMYEVIVPWLCRNLLARTSDAVSSALRKTAVVSVRDSKDDSAVLDTAAAATRAAEPTNADIFDKLSNLIESSNFLKGSSAYSSKGIAGFVGEDIRRMEGVLLVPEVTKLLATVGIQVTQTVVIELCRRYPSSIGLCTDKRKAVRAALKEKKLAMADAKVSAHTFSRYREDDMKGSRDRDAAGAKGGSGYENYRDGFEGEAAGAKDSAVDPAATAEVKSARAPAFPDRNKLDEVLASFDDIFYDTDQGLDVTFFLRELKNGRAIQSVENLRKSAKDFSDTGTGNAYGSSSKTGNLEKGIEKFCDGDAKRMAEIKELLEDSVGGAGAGPSVTATSLLTQLSCCVSVASMLKVRRQLVNLTDSYGRTPLLIAAANGHKHLVEILLANGGDTSVPAIFQSSSNSTGSGGYRYNALSLAATGSIRSLLEKALLTWLNDANIDGYTTTGTSASSDVGDILASLASEAKGTQKTLRETKTSFSCKQTLTPGIGLGLNEAYVSSGEEGLLYADTNAALSAKSALVLGMREHLEMLKSKNWAYSRCPLSWAVNNGLVDVVKQLLLDGANPNEVDTTGRTALHEAAALVNNGADALAEAALTCAELLLRAQADPNKSSVGSRSSLHELFVRGQDDAASSFGTVTAGKDHATRTKLCFRIDDGQSSAQRLMKSRRKRRMLRLLLQFGGNAQQLDRSGFAAVHYAAREADAGCVLEMLRYDNSAQESPRNSRDSSLMTGSSGSGAGGAPAGAAYVLTARTSQTPLHIACRAGASSVIQLLCRWEADARRAGNTSSLIETVDALGKVASQYLPASVAPAVLDTLWSLALSGAAVKLNSLLISLQTHGAADEVTDLSDDDEEGEFARIEEEGDDNGQDPAVDGYVADANELAHKYSDPAAERGDESKNDVDDYGATQRRELRRSRSKAPKRATAHEPWLVDGVNAKTRRLRWTPLHACVVGWTKAAAQEGNTAARRVVNNGSSTSSTPASASASRNKSSGAAVGNYQRTMQLLLQNRSYVDGADRQCRTPLMLAAAANLEPAIAMLLASGADVFARDLEGNTPCHMAYAYGSAGAAVTLEGRMGADFAASNHSGRTPLEMAGDMKRARNLLG